MKFIRVDLIYIYECYLLNCGAVPVKETSSNEHFEPCTKSDISEDFTEYPLLTTPSNTKASRHGENNYFSPFLLPTPKQTSTPGMCTSWGGDDAKLLEETFAKGYTICSTSSNKSGSEQQPRVYFKDQLSGDNDPHEGGDLLCKTEKEETPFRTRRITFEHVVQNYRDRTSSP